MYVSCMATTTISINQEAYQTLSKLKGQGKSFSDVIIENLKPRPKTCGELLESLERDFIGARLFDPVRVKKVREGRGRRSNRSPRSR